MRESGRRLLLPVREAVSTAAPATTKDPYLDGQAKGPSSAVGTTLDCAGVSGRIMRGRSMTDDEHDETIYRVVVNHEEQYSIWPEDKNLPAGWTAVGRQG